MVWENPLLQSKEQPDSLMFISLSLCFLCVGEEWCWTNLAFHWHVDCFWYERWNFKRFVYLKMVDFSRKLKCYGSNAFHSIQKVDFSYSALGCYFNYWVNPLQFCFPIGLYHLLSSQTTSWNLNTKDKYLKSGFTWNIANIDVFWLNYKTGVSKILQYPAES